MSEPNGEVGRKIGRLEGVAEALGDRVTGLSEHIRQLRDDNTRDHAEVVASLERISVKLDAKADTSWVERHEQEIDDLKSSRDKARGFMLAAVVVQSTLLLVVAVLSVLAALHAIG